MWLFTLFVIEIPRGSLCHFHRTKVVYIQLENGESLHFLDSSFPATCRSSRVHYLSSPGLLFPHWESLQRLAWCFWGRTEKNERRWPACYDLIPGGCNSAGAQRCRGIHCCALYWQRKRELPLAWNDGMNSGLKPLLVMTDWNIGF